MLNIRNAVLSDVGDLQELYMKHLTQYPPIEVQEAEKWADLLREFIDNPDYHLLVGELDGVKSILVCKLPRVHQILC